MSGTVIAVICSMSPNEGVSVSGPRALGHCLDNALIGSVLNVSHYTKV